MFILTIQRQLGRKVLIKSFKSLGRLFDWYSNIVYNLKLRCRTWYSNPWLQDERTVGPDESTELWPPMKQ